jgi:hypothetical protein
MKKTGSAAKRKGYQPIKCGQLFIVLNESAQAWTGLKGDDLAFSDNWEEAKPLENDIQFFHLEKMTYDKLEKIFL